MASILLVDDHPAICFALKITLEKNSVFTVNTSNGSKLIQQIHKDKPDLLLLDLELNGMDGLDVLPRIRQHFPHLKILIFTNQPAQIYAFRTLQAGANGFINKNITLDSLNALCYLILEGYHCFPDEVMNAIQSGFRSPASPVDVLSALSDRELMVLHYLKRGKTNKQIADSLQLSNKTISTYKARMFKKCGVESLDPLFALIAEVDEC